MTVITMYTKKELRLLGTLSPGPHGDVNGEFPSPRPHEFLNL